MKPMSKSSTVAVFTFLGLVVPALLLSGCAGNINFPDTVVPGTAQQTPLGALRGSVYGGHAPLTTSHVYVLEAGTGGYGTQATSLLGASASSAPGYATFQNVNDPGIPVGAYYVETDGGGQFNITGDYTCTAGLPVYLYAYGGFADYPQSSGYGTNNTFGVSNVSVSGSGLGPYTYTFTTTTPQYGYVGEQVTFNQAYGPFAAGTSYYMASWLSNTSFTLTSSSNSASSVSGLQATITPVFNPGIVNLAVLGVCPSSGNFTTGGTLFNGSTFSPLSYVYMNEVSTVAAAYAFAPFSSNANLSGGSFSLRGNYASYIGTSSTNLVGLQNAALTAGQLYSVNGTGPISTKLTGNDGHIANATTPTGKGIINQVTIDTVANILASCVDSNNTNTDASNYRDGISTQCLQLFVYATNTGVPFNDPTTPGIQPYDTATAAINIALHPTGPPPSYTKLTSSAWVAKLYDLPTADVPFTPNLTTQPNDLTVGILYTAANYPVPSSTNTYFDNVTSVAVDGIGDVWFNDAGRNNATGYIFSMSPLGVINNSYNNPNYGGTTISSSLVVDANQNIWSQGENGNGTAPTYYIQATGTTGNPYTYSSSLSTATPDSNGYFKVGTDVFVGDQNGNMYFIDPEAARTPCCSGYWNASYFPSGSFTDAGESPISASYFDQTDTWMNNGTADGNGNLFLTQANTGNFANIARVTLGSTPGAPTAGNWPVTSSTPGCGNLSPDPNPFTPSFGIGVTRSQDAIVASNNSNSVMYIGGSTGSCTELTNSSLGTAFLSPYTVVVDGRDYAYVLNFSDTAIPSGEGSITVLNTQAGTAAGTVAVSAALSPQYQPSGTLTSLLVQPSYLAIDASGNLWVANASQYDSRGTSVVEIIGGAAPTTTPVAKAACTGTVGCIGYAP
jgi:hypothetical protein